MFLFRVPKTIVVLLMESNSTKYVVRVDLTAGCGRFRIPPNAGAFAQRRLNPTKPAAQISDADRRRKILPVITDNDRSGQVRSGLLLGRSLGP